ncbi:tetratricopeptide repeat protein [Patescibacteria group bacterium]|nr:tetratricopeptide repeat protein [Patescibacteria group bacterium]MBU0963671.1 tetratricopeptide repeat protein [Patescibacteria group bacterium]
MIYDIIAIGIIIICIGAVVFVIAKKFPIISSINTKVLKKHQQEQVKKGLIEYRLKRKFGVLGISNKKKETNGNGKKKSVVVEFYDFLKRIEKRYRDKIREIEPEDEATTGRQKIILLQEARDLAEQEKFKEAEDKFIEIISLDDNFAEAYEGLAALYFEKKDFDHAQEIYEYLLKMETTDKEEKQPSGNTSEQSVEPGDDLKPVSINKEVASYHVGLGEIFLAKGDFKKAMDCFQEAIKLEPNNPRNLDVIIKTAIHLDNRPLAEKYITKLEQVNPENEKVKDFKKEVANLK